MIVLWDFGAYIGPMFKTLALACDHGGFSRKEEIKAFLANEYPSITVTDLGTHSAESVDYPEFGEAAGRAVAEAQVDGAIIICGTGIGISIAANRFPEVRAAVCTNATMARLTRQHNDANILALGERITGIEVTLECVRTFLDTEFDGGRHERRIRMLEIRG